MNDEDFENIPSSKGEVPPLNKEGGNTGLTNNSFPGSPPSLKGQVIERKLWTIQTIHIYPNGMMFIKKTQSWFDKNQKEVKKKVKKKLNVKEAIIGKKEEY